MPDLRATSSSSKISFGLLGVLRVEDDGGVGHELNVLARGQTVDWLLLSAGVYGLQGKLAQCGMRSRATAEIALQVSVLTIGTIFKPLSPWHFVLRQCRQDVGGVAGQQGCDG